MKALKHYFSKVLLVVLFIVVVTFESVVEILKSVYLNESLLGAIHMNPHVFETALQSGLTP